MLFRYKCLCRALSHQISHLLEDRNHDTPHGPQYENREIGKYLEAAEKLNIRVTPLGFGVYELQKGSMCRRLTSSLCLDRENAVTYKLCGNKYLTYRVLLQNGINCVPRHQLYTFNEVEKTCADFVEWRCPVVIKPCSGTSGGNGVTVDIRTVAELKNAIRESFVFDRRAYLMEQFIQGSHFRLLTLKGEFVACVQRKAARIVGNGEDSIRTLIERENERRRSDTSENALSPILMDNEVRRKLRSTGQSMSTVLRTNEEVFVRDTINFHAGGEVEDVDDVCEDVKRTCGRIAELLDIYLAGFDIITSDISKPLDETKGVINEVNTSPSMECMHKAAHHGIRVNIPEIILRDMFNLKSMVQQAQDQNASRPESDSSRSSAGVCNRMR